MARAADPARAREAALRVIDVLRGAGHTAYLAGGCVRDELLGLLPTDYDVATDAPPERLRSLFARTAEVGASFGVVLVREPGATVEVATFRADGPYSDRRRPDRVTFSDAASDARRRDFTINALFLDPRAPAESRVIDFVGGRADLEARVLRAVGDPDARLAEDHLRGLRAVRFAARFGLSIDPGTESAIRRHARELAGVSRERVGDEVRRMLGHRSRWRAVELLERLGLDGPVLGGASRGGGGAHGYPEVEGFAACLSAWALDRGMERSESAADAVVAAWRGALCLSNDEADELRGILRTTVRLVRDWDRLGVAHQKRVAAQPWIGAALSLLDARRAAGVRGRIAELSATAGGLAPVPLLDGDVLISAGFRPGPSFKAILERVYDEQLEGRVGTREAALELARSLRV